LLAINVKKTTASTNFLPIIAPIEDSRTESRVWTTVSTQWMDDRQQPWHNKSPKHTWQSTMN